MRFSKKINHYKLVNTVVKSQQQLSLSSLNTIIPAFDNLDNLKKIVCT